MNRQSIINQLAHVGVALVVVWFSGVLESRWIAGAYLGAALGCTREFTQMEQSFDDSLGLSRIRDIAFWAVGGAVGGWM